MCQKCQDDLFEDAVGAATLEEQATAGMLVVTDLETFRELEEAFEEMFGD